MERRRLVDARRKKAIALLRQAASLLEQDNEEWILPGWDVENEALPVLGGESHRERCAGIREAAKAVAAEAIDADHCTRVEVRKLGFLARYLGDILEE
jgi:hypothetical protein